MPISGPGNRHPRVVMRLPPQRGFTLIELLVVVAIIAFATAGVSFALRDTAASQLEREAQRLSALFESARAQSRTAGVAIIWQPAEGGFRFQGARAGTLPEQWLSDTTVLVQGGPVLLGPEPVIPRQAVVLGSTTAPERTLRVETDGLRPFAVASDGQP
jgi:general secretion pathway protein H